MEPFVKVVREAYGGMRHNRAAEPDMTFRGHLWAMCGSSAIALNYSQLFILPIHGGLGAAYITTALVSMLISSLLGFYASAFMLRSYRRHDSWTDIGDGVRTSLAFSAFSIGAHLAMWMVFGAGIVMVGLGGILVFVTACIYVVARRNHLRNLASETSGRSDGGVL